ncbi:protein translocase subunit SecF [Halomicrobium sp. HM KBTZ05]|uniref:Protein-export membrane protein SecF n=1 Tax=Halomicrobium mukohataei TaxID=57705 RepID=A0A847UBP9_9EURY|nr:protein translocase subunit SecF [Halomicrobium mukohataei]NLV09647.1 protein translocase subunit SecF [Halomicrobium mukohataei]
MNAFEVPEVDYDQYTNRQLAAVPLAVLALAILILVGWSLFVSGSVASPGAPVSPGIDFTGGSELTVVTSMSKAEIGDQFDTEPISVQQAAENAEAETVGPNENQYIVRFQSFDTQSLRDQAQSADMQLLSSSSTSATFGGDNQTTAVVGVLIAFAGMSAIVFALFRSFVPSIAVVVSAFSDIVIPLAAMNVLGIELSLGTVAALLMLIGYSVDSDILLNNHILRRSGSFYESVHRAMETGVTMTITSLSAMAVMAVVASFFNIQLMASIGTVLVIGLAADLMNTYMLNLSLLRWYKFEGVNR